MDFVSSAAGAQTYVSMDNQTWAPTAAAPTTFSVPTIGYMSQALLDFSAVAPGAKAYYKLASGGVETVHAVVPQVLGAEKFAVYGDFGLCVMEPPPPLPRGRPSPLTPRPPCATSPPTPPHPFVFPGSANDACMDTLIKGAAAGEFDSVLHVGDFA